MALSDDDRDLDETIEESFPASDPPANTVETGIHIDPTPQPTVAVDDRDEEPPS
jgi:hypothetical protein